MSAAKPIDVCGLVLAGGASSRFGTDKARYLVEGRAMVVRVVDVVSAVCHQVLVSVGAETPAFPSLDVAYVRDEYRGAGPLAGIHAGLRATAAPWLLVVACDMPFLTARTLEELLSHRRPGAQAVAATTPDGRLHPLCACYRRDILRLVEEHLASERLAVHALLERLSSVRTVMLPDDGLRNINTPGDLVRPVVSTRDL